MVVGRVHVGDVSVCTRLVVYYYHRKCAIKISPTENTSILEYVCATFLLCELLYTNVYYICFLLILLKDAIYTVFFPLLLFPILWPSQAYKAPLPNTIAAPTSTPGASRLPNSQMLSSKLANFRMFRTIVTVSAELLAPKRFTPRMQAYCVMLFAIRRPTFFDGLSFKRVFCTVRGRDFV